MIFERRFTRRDFLAAGAATGLAFTAAAKPSVPFGGIIDTHTHFYDPGRPQGVPWPPPGDPVLYRPVLPTEFERLVEPFGVTGTVAIEASPWVEDNQWLLDLADQNPFIVGVIGNLKPGAPNFRTNLRRFAKNRRFRGLRIGSENLRAVLAGGAAQDDLRQLAALDLSLDLLISPEELPDAARLAETLRDLRIVVDHCGNIPVGTPPPREWVGGLSACHYTPNVFMKVSGLVEGSGHRDGTAPTDPAFYHTVFEALWHPFGEDRLIYGSNWPVCLPFATYAAVLGIAEDYFMTKGERAAAKYFRRNADRVYRYVHR